MGASLPTLSHDGSKSRPWLIPPPQIYRTDGCKPPDREEVLTTSSSACLTKVMRYSHQYPREYHQTRSQQANDTRKQAGHYPPQQHRIHESCGSLKEPLKAHSETERWPQPKQSPAKTAPPDSPRRCAEMETVNKNKSGVSNRPEKQTWPRKTP